MVEIVAEIGVNHDGKIERALRMIDAAQEADVDVVKFQTYDVTKLLRPYDPSTQILNDLAFTHDQFRYLANYCRECEIEFMSTPGDVDSLKFLVEELGVKRIKIGSDDLTNEKLLQAAVDTHLPIIVSTGMATIKEIDMIPYSFSNYILLHCVSAYPCRFEDANLRAITTMQNEFDCPIGYSDHCPGHWACFGAVALGAVMIEKHFMLRRYDDCIDAPVSIDEFEMREMVTQCRSLEVMLGTGVKLPCNDEIVNIPLLRKGADGFRGFLK